MHLPSYQVQNIGYKSEASMTMLEKGSKLYDCRKYLYIPINDKIDAIPLGTSLIHDNSWVLLMKDEKIGIKNSKK